MMKRVLSLFVAILLVLQIQIIRATDIDNDSTSYAPYVRSEAFLKALGVVDGENNFDETVTRGKVAAYIAAMLDETGTYQNYRGVFSDVDSDNENALAIEKLADLGIVRGYGNYTFGPDEYLTYDEAIIIIMNALGYGLIPQKNIYSEAVKAGILDDINAEFDVVNTGDIFVMMYNALMANPITQTAYSSGGKYEKAGQTLLYKVFDVVYEDGIIVKNDLTYLWAALGNSNPSIQLETKSGSLEINSDNMENLREDLGKKVRVYYYEDRASGKYEYVHHELKTSNKSITVKLEQLDVNKTDFSSGKVVYWTSDSSRSMQLSLPEDCNLIYNNAAYKGKTVDFAPLQNKVGTLELIDAESDGKYETVKIKAYESYVVGSITEDTIVDKYKAGSKFKIDGNLYEMILVYDSTGNVSSFDKINSGSVLSVAISDTYADNDILEIRISDDIRKGKITKFCDNESHSYIIIDGKDTLNLYDRALADESGNKVNYLPNSNITAYIDVFGNIIHVSNDDSRDMQYGILTGVGLEKGFDAEVRVSLITAAGEVIETVLADKPIIDGQNYKNDENGAYKVLADLVIDDKYKSFVAGMEIAKSINPIRYRMDEEGKLKFIDTVTPGEGNNDALECVGGGRMVSIAGNVLGLQVPYSSDAVVLEITANDFMDTDVYREAKRIKTISTSTAFRIGQSYNVLAYRSGHENKRADFIIKFNSNAMDANSVFFTVDEVIQAYNEEYDEIMYKICGYTGVGREERWVSNALDINVLMSYNKGDVLFMPSNTGDFLYSYKEVLIQNESGITYKNPENGHSALNTQYSSSLMSLCGYVKSKEDTLVYVKRYDFGKIDPVENVNWEENFNFVNLEAATCVVVDKENDSIYNGSVSEILDYDNFKKECSLILVRMRSSYINHVIVYK